MASNLTVDTLTKGATTLNTDELVDVNNTRVAKAWVNFNGTGTPAIRDSFNVSSITDNGTGNYTVNFTTALTDANYSTTASAGRNATGTGGYLAAISDQVAQTASATACATFNLAGTNLDAVFISCTSFSN
jgi:hypothetical protein|tara:strand:- start:700 stop:1092 length:393 start_codon:yes stop_codon:yes gene_type:complete